MNERIRDLYRQARLHAKSIDADIDPKGWMDLYHQKFAELIVRECIETMYDTEQITVAQFVDTTLKEHFGVEK